jgi:hypothetical protein
MPFPRPCALGQVDTRMLEWQSWNAYQLNKVNVKVMFGPAR